MKKAVLALTVLLACASSALAAENSARHEKIAAALNADGGAVFPIGVPNDRYAKYFSGPSWVAPLAKDVPTVNVTFEDGARTVWHIHHGTCQILLGASGRGAYQIWGQPVQKLNPGDSVSIPAGVKHWHGAAPGHCFQHVAVMQPVKGARTEWLEPVDETTFEVLK